MCHPGVHCGGIDAAVGPLCQRRHLYHVAGSGAAAGGHPAWAWVDYLRLDGVTIHHLAEEFKDMGKKKKRHATKSIVDYADERIVSFEELEPEERIFCSLLSNLVLGLPLVVISLIAGAM